VAQRRAGRAIVARHGVAGGKERVVGNVGHVAFAFPVAQEDPTGHPRCGFTLRGSAGGDDLAANRGAGTVFDGFAGARRGTTDARQEQEEGSHTAKKYETLPGTSRSSFAMASNLTIPII
jgi:hypothetical protein